MKTTQLALQLYTLRETTQTSAALAETLRKVKAIGYSAVQVSAVGPIPELELKRLIADAGLVLCATHEPSQSLLSEPMRVIERLEKLDCIHTAYPYPHEIDMADATAVRAWIKRLDEVGALLREHGKVLSYHNHALEFVRLGDATVLDAIYAETSPDNLKAELDTYWIQAGGGDPATWCRRMKGRMPLLHMKDFVGLPNNSQTLCEVGAGNLDFPGIVAAADEGGCEWFIVEQDTCVGDPFEAIARSYEYCIRRLV